MVKSPANQRIYVFSLDLTNPIGHRLQHVTTNPYSTANPTFARNRKWYRVICTMFFSTLLDYLCDILIYYIYITYYNSLIGYIHVLYIFWLYITYIYHRLWGSPPPRCGRRAPWRCGAASASTAWRRWELEKVEDFVFLPWFKTCNTFVRWGCIKIYRTWFWGDEHPFASNLGFHQGAKVLTHRQIM